VFLVAGLYDAALDDAALDDAALAVFESEAVRQIHWSLIGSRAAACGGTLS
jgi:hypothetical protein